MKGTVKSKDVEGVVTRRVERLRGLSFAAISRLPQRQDEAEVINGREIAVATYREGLPDDRIRVVVQAYYHRFLGVGTMCADGFLIGPGETLAAVPKEMMWEFI